MPIVCFPELIDLQLLGVSCDVLADGVGLEEFIHFFVAPELAVALVFDFDPIVEGVGSDAAGCPTIVSHILKINGSYSYTKLYL